MALADVIPTITSARMLRYLSRTNIWMGLTNRMFESELARGGDSITIAPIGTDFVSVTPYVPGTTDITYPNVTVGAPVQLDINETDSWAFALEDVHRREAIPNIFDEAMKVAADKAATSMNTDIRAAYLANMAADHVLKIGDTTGDGTLIDWDGNLSRANGESRFGKLFSTVALYLDAVRLPPMGNWAVVGPLAYQHMVREEETFLAVDEQVRQRTRGSGMLGGMLHGFRIVKDPHYAPVKTAAADWAGTVDYLTDQIIFGNDYACAAVVEISKTERLRLEKKFATAVRGLVHYGAKVIEPKGLFRADCFYKGVTYPA